MANDISLRTQMESELARGDVGSAVTIAQGALADSRLDTGAAEWLLGEARGWHAQGLMRDQRAVCEMVLALLPEHFEALHLLGHEAQARGEFKEAEGYYARAASINPDYAFAKLALSQLRMMRSDFAEGRDLYEARFEAKTENSGPDWRSLPIPRWQGEPLTGRNVYVWPEQGLGDIVMFAGFLGWLKAQSPRRIVLGMFPKLVTLFRRSFPELIVESSDDALRHALGPSALEAFPNIEKLAGHITLPFSLAPLRSAYDYVRQHGLFDVALPMGDLLVHAMPGYVPAKHAGAYLKADPEKTRATRERIARIKKGRRIGISWHTTNRREWMRNVPLEEWIPLLRSEDCHFVSLQHHMDEKDMARFCAEHDCPITIDRVDLLNDAEGLAALIAAMDEVVTIDNSNAHLAGGLGVPVTVLLPRGHNYRWPAQPDDRTLWYQSMRLLRQTRTGEWRDVMQRMAAQLKNRKAD